MGAVTKYWAILILLLGCAATARAETWHVDSERGDDARSGLTPATAWRSLARLQQAPLQPGDVVLLATGSVWREPLLITRSGTEPAPITIARADGKGSRPRIETGDVAENAVEIRNADNLIVSGLEITNKGVPVAPRRGVFVNQVDFGVARNIVLRDLYIHDVNGSNERKDHGGIVFSALGPKVPTRYEGITIERNILWRVDRSGHCRHQRSGQRRALVPQPLRGDPRQCAGGHRWRRHRAARLGRRAGRA